MTLYLHTVIKQSPPEVLGEIVMVDDFSAKAHLKEQLDEHLKQFNGLVKVVRNERREGLIRARSIGAQNAKEEVLVFLDLGTGVYSLVWYSLCAHC